MAVLEDYMKAEDEPHQEIGQYCFSPYKCGFFRYCSRDLPSPNIFDVVDMQLRTKFKYIDEGLVSFEDLYRSGELGGKHLLQITHELYDVEDKIDKDIIREFVNSLKYPLYFIDFETSQEAVPEYDGCKPYEQMPFQYSLHILHENGELEHKEFLAEAGSDPRRIFAERLCEDVPKGVCSVSYNMEFEKVLNGILKYINQEVMVGMNDWQEMLARIAISRMIGDSSKLKETLASNGYVRTFGIMDRDGNVDVDGLMRDIREQIERKGKVSFEIPLMGKFTFRPEDVDRLHEKILEA
jgi:hypothetical protein